MSAMKIAAIAAIFMVPLLSAAGRPNVLFIAVDDLRPWLGCYEEGLKVSPNIDRLAAGGRLFSRHYVQVPTCGASRCALMFGRYPGRLAGDTGNEAFGKTAAKQPHPSLPALFRGHGYRTLSIGKITHYPGGRGGNGWKDGPEELPGAWDVSVMPAGPWKNPEAAMHGYAGGVPRSKGGEKSPLTEFAPGDDRTCPDGWIADEAVARLREAAGGDKPFFLAAGFIKPHLPFVAPAPYLKEIATLEIPAPDPATKPDFPSTWHSSAEFRRYRFNEGDPFASAEAARDYRRAYLACIRYTDAQVGKLLAALDESPAGTNTVVVLWSDHGWLHGEHGIWGKHCLFEEALRSPLIIRLPGQNRAGEKSDQIVETVDLFPTLAGLAGIPAPGTLEGKSLEPILSDARSGSDGIAIGAWKDKLTIRKDRFRMIVSRTEPDYVELYDHDKDPAEKSNSAKEHPGEVNSLRKLLDRAIPAAKP